MQVGLSLEQQKATPDRRSTPRPKASSMEGKTLRNRIAAKAVVRKRRQPRGQALGLVPKIALEEVRSLRTKTSVAFWLVFAIFLGAQNVWAILATTALFAGLSGILDYLSYQPIGSNDKLLGRGALKIMGALIVATGVITLSGLDPSNGVAFVIVGGTLLFGTFAVQESDLGGRLFRYIGDLVALVLHEASLVQKASSNWLLAALELGWEGLQRFVGTSLNRAAHGLVKMQEQLELSGS